MFKTIYNIRLACLIMTIILAATMSPSVFASENKAATDTEIKLLNRIGVLSDEDINKIDMNAVISRAQFCRYISKLMNLDISITDDTDIPFRDIDSTHEDYKSVCELYNLKILSGRGRYIFAPNEAITMLEGVRMLIIVLGYEQIAESEGALPNGYYSVANSSKLVKSGTEWNAEITYGQAMKLFYNALFVEEVEITQTNSSQFELKKTGSTFMENVYNTKELKGLVYESAITSFKGIGKLKDGQVRINDEIYDCLDKDIENYVGYYVTYYVRDDEKSDNDIIFFDVEDKYNKIIRINAEDILSVSTTDEMVYEDDNGKEKKVKLSSVANVIVNKAGKPDYTVTDLTPTLGEIITNDINDDNVADIVFINKSDLITVDEIYNTDKALRIRGKNNENFIVDKESVNCRFIVYKDEKKVTVDDISKNSVLYVQDSGVLKGERVVTFIIGSEQINGVLRNITDEEVQINNTVYGKNILYDTTDVGHIIGTEVNAYLDADGNVAYVEKVAAAGNAYGYLYRAVLGDTGEEDVYVKVVMEDNICHTFMLADKVKNNDKRYTALEMYKLLAPDGATQMQLIRFRINDNNIVDQLDIAAEVKDDEEEEKLQKTNTFRISAPRKKRFFENRSKLFMSGPGPTYWTDLFTDSTMKTIIRPGNNDISAEDIRFVEYSYFKADQAAFDMEGYDLSDTNVLGAVVIYGEKAPETPDKDQEFVVIDKIWSTLDEDDNVIEVLDVYERGILKSYKTEKEGLLQYKGVALKRGDITRIILNNEGEISAIENTALKFTICDNPEIYFTDPDSVGSDRTEAYPYYQVVIGEVERISGDMLKVRVKDSNMGKTQYLKAMLRTDTKYVKCDEYGRGGYTLSIGKRTDLIPGSVVVLRIHWTTLYDVVIYNI